MSKHQTDDRVSELGEIFVSVTGDDSVTEAQEDESTDRELPEDHDVDVEDGLEDAVAGAEVGEVEDPVE